MVRHSPGCECCDTSPCGICPPPLSEFPTPFEAFVSVTNVVNLGCSQCTNINGNTYRLALDQELTEARDDGACVFITNAINADVANCSFPDGTYARLLLTRSDLDPTLFRLVYEIFFDVPAGFNLENLDTLPHVLRWRSSAVNTSFTVQFDDCICIEVDIGLAQNSSPQCAHQEPSTAHIYFSVPGRHTVCGFRTEPITITSTAFGTLSVGPNTSLEGSSSFSLSATGTLSVATQETLTGTSNISTSASGMLTKTGQFLASSSIQISSNAQLTRIVSLTGSSQIAFFFNDPSSSVAPLSITHDVSGSSTITVSGSGSLTVGEQLGLTGSASFSTSASGSLDALRQVSLEGSSSISCSASGSLDRFFTKRFFVAQPISFSAAGRLSISPKGTSTISVTGQGRLAVNAKSISAVSTGQLGLGADGTTFDTVTLAGISTAQLGLGAEATIGSQVLLQAAGTAQLGLGATGGLHTKINLQGTATAQLGLQAKALVNGLQGSSLITFSGNARPSHLEINLTGETVTRLFFVTGRLLNIDPPLTTFLTGTSVIDTSATAVFSKQIGLHGTANMLTNAVSQMASTVGRAGTSTILTRGTGKLSRTVGLAGSSHITSFTNASLSQQFGLIGSSTIQITTSATLAVDFELMASSSITFSSSATLTVDSAAQKNLSGDAVISFSSSASLGNQLSLVGSSSFSVTATGQANLTRNLTGTSSITTSASGSFSFTRGLQGFAAATISSSAQSHVTRSLQGTSTLGSTARSRMDIFALKTLTGTSQINVSATGDLSNFLARSLSGQSSIFVTANGVLSVTLEFCTFVETCFQDCTASSVPQEITLKFFTAAESGQQEGTLANAVNPIGTCEQNGGDCETLNTTYILDFHEGPTGDCEWRYSAADICYPGKFYTIIMTIEGNQATIHIFWGAASTTETLNSLLNHPVGVEHMAFRLTYDTDGNNEVNCGTLVGPEFLRFGSIETNSWPCVNVNFRDTDPLLLNMDQPDCS